MPVGTLYQPAHEYDACGVGCVADIKGRPSPEIIRQALAVLVNLEHRGAAGSDPESGDGAGILTQMPDAFLRRACAEARIALPPGGEYGAGNVFLPKDNAAAATCMQILARAAREEGCGIIGWRDVPVDEEAIGRTARSTCPRIRQVFIAKPEGGKYAEPPQPLNFERKLYLIRRLAEKWAQDAAFPGHDKFYICSLSSRTLVYKGMMHARQITSFYPDLSAADMASAIAVVHQRYSTNTFPSWPLAHPFRFVAHNGEINTLRGNLNKMKARERSLSSEIWGDDIHKIVPVIREGKSDSASFDDLLELLVLSGRTLPHAILMMIPEAWGAKYYMGHDRRGFYEYHANFLEPWDGPAAMVFSDGTLAGGILDRNGLRPARYMVTRDGRFILASETGVLDMPASQVLEKGRLQPGKMLLVDTGRGRLIYNDEIKAEICRQKPYRRWVSANRIEIENFGAIGEQRLEERTLLTRQLAFGYTREELDLILGPMAATGEEPVGSMGNDTPLAVLSDQPQSLFSYFKQYFAQVTNPPIDPIREELVMSLTTFLGPEGNILEETPEHARRLKLFSPILTDDNLERIRRSNVASLRSATLPAIFTAGEGTAGLASALALLQHQAEQAVAQGYGVIILSDRLVSETEAAIPSLLAIGAVNRHLTRLGIRNRIGLVAESGEPREVNHFALLLSFGADAVNPYLALETVLHLHRDGVFSEEISAPDAIEHYLKAIQKGLLKILSKLGISTLRSYRGAQCYEAIGLSPEIIDNYFPHTISRIGGIGLSEIAAEALARHRQAFGKPRGVLPMLPVGGIYAYRRGGERHLWTPETIHLLQQAVRRDDAALYRRFAELIDCQDGRHVTLRSLFAFRADPASAAPLAEVEPVASIVRRFFTGAMSLGSLSPEAHETIAAAMNQLGGASNSGEGGESPARYRPRADGVSVRSEVKQVASGRFGVTIEYLVNCREIQIKIAQGAKPGEGGQLPGHKVEPHIAEVRHSIPGVSLISPPPHHDIYSIEDLAQLIYDLKNANPEARISVKLVSQYGVGTVAAGVAKGHADMVLISGGDGGTGASPLSSIKHAGIPWEIGLAETQQTLIANDLRSRIRVQVDGQMRTGRDVAIAALLGAEEYGFGTAALVALGCVMMRECHLNTCPVGIATQDVRCRQRFRGRPEHLIRYFQFVAQHLREIMASLGMRTVDEMVGRVDLLQARADIAHWKAKTLDLSAILAASAPPDAPRRCIAPVPLDLSQTIDSAIIAECQDAIAGSQRAKICRCISNANRSIGAMLSSAIAKRHGLKGLPEDSITLCLTGSAGQSCGAFLAHGVTLIVEGDANDYLGKGLSGGKIIVYPPRDAAFVVEENIVVGNTVLYGATSGEAYISGLAGERFAVRNSGATAVVEGVGDHGCEYMTGGVVAVLGGTGVNFAAGMSGGIAYVYDPHQDFDLRCNLSMVDLEPLVEAEDIARLRLLIERHVRYTGSSRGRWLLENWDMALRLFVKVMPIEYRRALGQMAKADRESRRTPEEIVRYA